VETVLGVQLFYKPEDALKYFSLKSFLNGSGLKVCESMLIII
jgi:hypothetical protein